MGKNRTDPLEDILAGSDDEEHLFALYQMIGVAKNPPQRTFVTAWELHGFIAGDGFEFLYEQDEPLEKWLGVFLEIGCPEVEPVFKKVLALVPNETMQRPDRQKILGAHFEPLKECLYEFVDATNAFSVRLAKYVRDHREAFGQ